MYNLLIIEGSIKFVLGEGEGIATKVFFVTISQLKVAKGLEPSMDVLHQTLIQVNDCTQ